LEKSHILSALARLRIVGGLEGVSFLVLLAIAMPMKYLAGRPEAVQVVGWMHGVLFVLYVAAVGDVWWRARWPVARVFGALVASVLPFGTFVFDRSLRRETAALRPT
jgi:integral membrane protein